MLLLIAHHSLLIANFPCLHCDKMIKNILHVNLAKAHFLRFA
jgi:hypothetical protein